MYLAKMILLFSETNMLRWPSTFDKTTYLTWVSKGGERRIKENSRIECQVGMQSITAHFLWIQEAESRLVIVDHVIVWTEQRDIDIWQEEGFSRKTDYFPVSCGERKIFELFFIPGWNKKRRSMRHHFFLSFSFPCVPYPGKPASFFLSPWHR